MATHASPGAGTFWWRTLPSGKRVYSGRAIVGGRMVTASLTLGAGLVARTVEQRVRAALRERVARVRLGLDVEERARRLTLGAYGDTVWLPGVRDRLEPSSALSYEVLWRKHVKGERPAFPLERRLLLDLRVQHVRDWLTALGAAGRRSGTRELAFTLLLAILREARGDFPGQFPNLTAIEDASARLRPKHELPSRTFPTPAQVRRLFASLAEPEPWVDRDPPFGAVVHLIYYTAKRVSEVLGLCWGDWDEVAGGLWVRRQQDHHTRVLREYPKHDRHQYLELAPEAVSVLRAHRALALGWGLACRPTDQIFTDEAGVALTHKRVWSHYKRALAAAGLPSFRLHDLRGGFAMAARRGGLDDRTIAESLGHAGGVGTLHAHYFDRSSPRQAEAADAAARAVREALSSVTSSVSGEDPGGSPRSPGRSRTRKNAG